jgi:hypothetical protein
MKLDRILHFDGFVSSDIDVFLLSCSATFKLIALLDVAEADICRS